MITDIEWQQNLIFMLEQQNKTVLEISILVPGLDLGLTPLLTSYFEDELQRSYSNRKEQVKSYFANIVFKFEQLWIAEQEIQ